MKRENFISALEIASILGGVVAFVALTLGPMFYLGTKMDSIKSEMHNMHNGLKSEMHNMHSGLTSEMNNMRIDIKTETFEFKNQMKDLQVKLDIQDSVIASLQK